MQIYTHGIVYIKDLSIPRCGVLGEDPRVIHCGYQETTENGGKLARKNVLNMLLKVEPVMEPADMLYMYMA